MEFNGVSALKHIKYLEDEKNMILEKERNNSTTIVVDGKEVETEEYNFIQTRELVNEIDKRVLKMKHELNIFNATTMIAPLMITIDTALIMLAQKNKELEIVKQMRSRAKESYENNYTKSYIRKINYSLQEVSEYHKTLMKEIHELQMKIDEANMSKTFIA